MKLTKPQQEIMDVLIWAEDNSEDCGMCSPEVAQHAQRLFRQMLSKMRPDGALLKAQSEAINYRDLYFTAAAKADLASDIIQDIELNRVSENTHTLIREYRS